MPCVCTVEIRSYNLFLWKQDYCVSQLNNRSLIVDDKDGYTLGCPVKCPDSLVTEPKHFKAILDLGQYDR